MSNLQHCGPQSDLHSARQNLRLGNSSPVADMEASIAIAQAPVSRHVYLKTMFEEARLAASQEGMAQKPLAGLAISVKDLFDVQGQITTAGSTVLANAAPALEDAPAVRRLKAAGGVVLGRTNMVEFAFSGVGINPHFGTPLNAAATRASSSPRVPGGSSSGAAVAVQTGSSWVGLGSDTAGSIRVPAALNGVVGFKSTARLVPTAGALPLSTTLDTVCAITRSVRDATLMHEILSAQAVVRSTAPLSAYRLAVVKTLMQDDLDPTVAAAWDRSLAKLRQQGAQVEEIALPELLELPAINATGGFSPSEAFAWHYPLLQHHKGGYDPRVLARILRGANMSAREYLELLSARKNWMERTEKALARFDAVVSPTVPIVAPPLADVDAGSQRDEHFFKVNMQLLRNTGVVNMLDGCAISIPCHQPDELPVGLMVWSTQLKDDLVLNIAKNIENLL
jgi:Asp-tRNA(Asn)/Glu-tRNA(Gln) amidotransferase A subunit family amidase